MFLIFTYSPTPFFPSTQFSLIQLPVLRLEYHALHHVTSPLITLCISYIHLHIERTKLGWYAWLQACATSGYGWRKRARTRGEAAKDILLIASSPFLPRLRYSFAPPKKLPSTLASMTMWNHNVHLIKNKNLPDLTCTTKPVLRKIISHSSFPNNLSPFGQVPLPFPWLEIPSGTLHCVLNPPLHPKPSFVRCLGHDVRVSAR